MKVLNTSLDLEDFRIKMEETPRKALLLDYDGTLAPFNEEPDRAEPYPGVWNVLGRIMEDPCVHVAIVSGRWIKDLDPLLKLPKRPEIWGSHGIERMKPDGSYEIAPMEEHALNGIVAADEWVETVGFADRCEKKPGCLALHWRGHGKGEIDRMQMEVGPQWSLIAQAWGLNLKEFDGGLELKVPVRNKGDAVIQMLDELGSPAVAAYLGDDTTDEDAFRSIKGKGIGVLVRKELRPTSADLWLTPPEELLEFLSSWTSENSKEI